jgi:hypothetical protein
VGFIKDINFMSQIQEFQGKTLPFIMISKFSKFDENRIIFYEENLYSLDKDHLDDYIKIETLPLIAQLDDSTFMRIFGSSINR